MWFKCIFLGAVFSIVATPISAHEISCPGKVEGVILEEGTTWSNKPGDYRNAIEPDIGGDYDENAPQAEWNQLNDDPKVSVLVHCSAAKHKKEETDIWLPKDIKRCIARKHEFSCTSDTISCVGYVGNVTIESISDRGDHRVLQPNQEDHDGKNKEWQNLKTNPRETLFANCFPEYMDSHGDYDIMQILPEMNSCRLKNKRFVCSK